MNPIGKPTGNGLGLIINVLTVLLLGLSITKEVKDLKAQKKAAKGGGKSDEG